jgi:hypothetical protein
MRTTKTLEKKLSKIAETLDPDFAVVATQLDGQKKPFIITGPEASIDELIAQDAPDTTLDQQRKHAEAVIAPFAAAPKPKVGMTHLVNLIGAKIAQKRAIDREYKTWCKALKAAQEIDELTGSDTAGVLLRERREKIYKERVRKWNKTHGKAIDVKLLPSKNRNADGTEFVKRDQNGYVIS